MDKKTHHSQDAADILQVQFHTTYTTNLNSIHLRKDDFLFLYRISNHFHCFIYKSYTLGHKPHISLVIIIYLAHHKTFKNLSTKIDLTSQLI